MGNCLVGAFFERAEPMNTKNWLAESPKECIISANSATFPVKKKATPFNVPKIRLTIAAIKEDLLPPFSKVKNSPTIIPSYINSISIKYT